MVMEREEKPAIGLFLLVKKQGLRYFLLFSKHELVETEIVLEPL